MSTRGLTAAVALSGILAGVLFCAVLGSGIALMAVTFTPTVSFILKASLCAGALGLSMDAVFGTCLCFLRSASKERMEYQEQINWERANSRRRNKEASSQQQH